jgi:hypothetical protein
LAAFKEIENTSGSAAAIRIADPVVYSLLVRKMPTAWLGLRAAQEISRSNRLSPGAVIVF